MNNNILSKKLSELMGKMDEKVLKSKLNHALDMLKNGDTQELASKINKIDKTELLNRINEFDSSKLNELNIDKNELKNNISEADLNKLSELIGENGDQVIKKIREILDNK